MAELIKVEKKISMDSWDIVKFQLITHCYLNRIHLSDHDLSCLALLSITGPKTLEDFCSMACSNEIFSSNQSARNALTKAERKNLIVKEGYNKKKIYINPDLKIQSKGNILLDYKIFHIEKIESAQNQRSLAEAI